MQSMDRDTLCVESPAGLDIVRPRLSMGQLQAALDSVSDAILFLAPESLRLADSNRSACARFGFTQDELLDLTLPEIVASAALESLEALLDSVGGDHANQVECELRFRRRCGTEFSATTVLQRISDPDEELLILVIKDPQPSVKVRIDADRMRLADSLTGFPCRVSLIEDLQERVDRSRRNCDRFAVLFLDVDHFKQINDTYGHLKGDRVLATVAERLSQCLRPCDCAVRYGGDEFVAIVANVQGEDDAVAVAQRIQQAMRPEVGFVDPAIQVTASIGIALSHDGWANAEDLLHAADMAMYRAKGKGRQGHFAVERHISRSGPGDFSCRSSDDSSWDSATTGRLHSERAWTASVSAG